MSIEAEIILSKALNENNVDALGQNLLSHELLTTETERKAFDFIQQFAIENEGNAPSAEQVAYEVPQFNYVAETEQMTFRSLVKKLNDAKLAHSLGMTLANDISTEFRENASKDPVRSIDTMISQLTALRNTSVVKKELGSSVKQMETWYLDEYNARQSGESSKVWQSSFPKLNEFMGGGYMSGNSYASYAESGRGKSVLALIEAIHASKQGAKVLIWSLEMDRYMIASRLLSFLSASEGLIPQTIAGATYDAGFKTNEMLTGVFQDPQNEETFLSYLKQINSKIAGDIIIRGKTDKDFRDRSVAELERNIIETEADFVVIDPIYLLKMQKNTSRTTGGDMQKTSQDVCDLAGFTNTVILVITQASSPKERRSEERELRLPQRSDIRKSPSIIEDATYTFAFDSCDGMGRIGVVKGRSGSEDEEMDLIFLPQIGYVKETSKIQMREGLLDEPIF